MAKVKLESEIGVAPDDLWRMIGQFNALPDWHPAIESSDLEDGGRIRRLRLFGGGEIVERLEMVDDDDRLYRYSIISGPLPVANYTATMRVRDDGKGNSRVEWSSEFEPSGTSESDAIQAIQEVYQAGFDNLKKIFGI
jgi:hypothetical protein